MEPKESGSDASWDFVRVDTGERLLCKCPDCNANFSIENGLVLNERGEFEWQNVNKIRQQERARAVEIARNRIAGVDPQEDQLLEELAQEIESDSE